MRLPAGSEPAPHRDFHEHDLSGQRRHLLPEARRSLCLHGPVLPVPRRQSRPLGLRPVHGDGAAGRRHPQAVDPLLQRHATPTGSCFSYNSTDALNLALFGLLSRRGPRDHDHHRAQLGAAPAASPGAVSAASRSTTSRSTPAGSWIPKTVAAKFKREHEGGRDQPRLERHRHGAADRRDRAPCRERGIRLVVDASQTAGKIPIDVQAMDIDVLAFTGTSR